MSLLNEASFLVTPNGYKEDKLYAAIPTNGNGDMTFTRGTTATRVNEAGLVELVPYNLFPYSEDFSQWNIFRSTLTSNATTSPDGTINADLVNQNYPTTSVHGGVSRTKAVSTGVKYTYSIFVKKKEYSWIELAESATSAVNISTWFDVENGVVGTVGAGSTAQIEDFGNDWYRCSISITSAFTGNRNFILYLTTGNNTATANKVGGAYIYGAQLVEGSSALTYQKTVDRLDIPRIDYTDGGCPSILLEPQRTNLLLRSQEFDNASWLKHQVNVTPNALTAPDGTLTADLATVTSDGGNRLNQAVAVTASTTYTFSFYAKAGTLETSKYSVYDLTNSAYILSPAVYSMTGEWQRITLTFTTPVGCTNIWIYASHETASGTYYVWGAQLEAGAYPTSYIPTTTGKLARNADAISKTGISDLINSEEGVLFIEFKTLSETGTFRQFNLSKDSGNRIYITKRGDNGNLEFRMANPSGNLNFSFVENTTNDFVKVAFRYGLNNFAVFIDGVNKNVTSTGNVFASGTLNTLQFDSPLSQPFFGKVKQLALFPTPLSDDQCIALTTL